MDAVVSVAIIGSVSTVAAAGIGYFSASKAAKIAALKLEAARNARIDAATRRELKALLYSVGVWIQVALLNEGSTSLKLWQQALERLARRADKSDVALALDDAQASRLASSVCDVRWHMSEINAELDSADLSDAERDAMVYQWARESAGDFAVCARALEDERSFALISTWVEETHGADEPD